MPTPQRIALAQAFERFSRLIPARLRRWWAAQDSHFRHRFKVNLLLVGLIELALGIAHALHLPVVVRMENWGIDRTIAFLGNRTRDHTDEPWVGLALVDIDDRTWREWGTPSVVPRSRLHQLLAWAAGSEARAIVVDIDVAQPQGFNGTAPDSADSAFAGFLRQYRGPVPLVLARTLEPSENDPARLPAPRSAWFEASLPDSARHYIRWATVQFIVEPDGIVRRWRLWEPVCDHGVPLALPSVELLLPALVNSGSSTAQADSVRLERLLHRAAPAGCGNAEEHGSTGFRSDADSGPPVDSLWGKPVRISTDLVPQRIVYQIPWREDGRPPDVGNVALPTGGVGPLFTRIRAGEVTREPDTPSSGALTGRIVIIGGSFQQGRDLHQTPIGPMPGAMVVANSIASFRSHGQLQPLAWPWRLVAIAILGLLAALTYAHFHPLLATGMTGLVLLFVVAPISFLVFRGSVWLDFAVPLLGIQLHELIADLEDAWTLRGRRPDPPSGTAH